MPKIFILLIVPIFSLSSCSQIKPEIPTDSGAVIVEHTAFKSAHACGIITCEAQDNLSKLQEEGRLKLPNLEYYRKRFSLIADRYADVNALIESSEFKKFVEDVNIDFFSCEGDVHLCEPKSQKYWYNETNYLYYVFVPSIVIDEYQKKPGKTDMEIEDIIQSIKRKDFIIEGIKDSYVTHYDDKVKERLQKLDISYIDKNRLKSDKEYFKQVIFAPWIWLYDKFIFDASADTDWVWVNEEQVERITEINIAAFYDKMKELWIEKDYIENITSIDEVISDMKTTTESLNRKFSLDKKIPIDRFYRNDELFIFNDKNRKDFEMQTFWENKDFIQDVMRIRHDTYMLFLLGKNENLFFLPNRLNRMNFENGFIATNIFEYSKHMHYDVKY